jgi:hypothetical protein
MGSYVNLADPNYVSIQILSRVMNITRGPHVDPSFDKFTPAFSAGVTILGVELEAVAAP